MTTTPQNFTTLDLGTATMFAGPQIAPRTRARVANVSNYPVEVSQDGRHIVRSIEPGTLADLDGGTSGVFLRRQGQNNGAPLVLRVYPPDAQVDAASYARRPVAAAAAAAVAPPAEETAPAAQRRSRTRTSKVDAAAAARAHNLAATAGPVTVSGSETSPVLPAQDVAADAAAAHTAAPDADAAAAAAPAQKRSRARKAKPEATAAAAPAAKRGRAPRAKKHAHA